MIRSAARVGLMDEPHEARLLLLLLAAEKKSERPVDGLTKLAKLDFLLRYPNCLERALKAAEKDPSRAHVQPYERANIETSMIRFRYGPWDHRYRRWIALLSARRLVGATVEGRTVRLHLTPMGRSLAASLATQEAFQDLAVRSRVVTQAFGDLTGSRLKNFIYEVFPELTNMRWGEEIVL
ncbi:MAG: hypothetical protein IPI67_26825 [Myxococcales bacterium]|nr:hypothetical protein [Myxococcales bacterium]